ncbi:MAG TPA: hypothetical protein VFY84_19205 [Jiangellales bacterium]|nr:hypothetical protein [Jiangellales bacterium]
MNEVEYMPDIVTRLRGDNSSLNKAFAEATATEKAFEKTTEGLAETVNKGTAGMDSDFGNFASNLGRHSRKGSEALVDLRRHLRQLEEDAARLRRKFSVGQFFGNMITAGRAAGTNFVSGFTEAVAGIRSAIVPLLIGAVVLALPAIGALIASAVTVGLGLGFAGLGVILAAVLMPKFQAQFARIGKNFKAALLGAISGAFDDELRKALRSFNLMIPQFGVQLRKIFDALAPALDPLAQALGTGISIFLEDIAKVIPQIMPALLVWIETIPDVMAALSEFLITITRDGPALSRFITDAANAIAQFLHGAGEVISWLSRAYLWIVKLNDAFPFIGWQRQLIGLGDLLSDIGGFFADLWDKIVNGGKAVGAWFANLGRNIWNWLGSAVDAVANFVGGVIDWFKLLPGRVIAFLASMPGRVTAVVKDMAHQAAYWVGWLVGQWVRFITQAPGKIVSVVAGVWVWVQNKTREGIAATIAHIQAFPGQVAAFFMQLYVDVTGWVKRTWEAVTGWFARTKQSVIEHVAAAINAVVAWFRGLPDRAAKEAKSFKDRLTDFFKGAKDWLYEAGRNVVRGVIGGITSMWDWAVDKIKSFGHDIAEGFKDALGIHSPSTVAFEAGEFWGQGFMGGVARSMEGIRSLWRSLRGRNSPVGAVTITGSSQPPGPVRRFPGPGGGDGGGPYMVHTTVAIDGRAIVTAITPAAQRVKARSGATGLA